MVEINLATSPVKLDDTQIKKSIEDFSTVLENRIKGYGATLEENNTISAWLFGISVTLFAFLFSDVNFRAIISEWIKTILLFHAIQLGLVLVQKSFTKAYKSRGQVASAYLSMQKVYLQSNAGQLKIIMDKGNTGLGELFKDLDGFHYLKALAPAMSTKIGRLRFWLVALWWLAIISFIALLASFIIGYYLFIEAGWKLD